MEKTTDTAAYSDYLKEQNITDDLYSRYEKQTGLSDAEFWCMFSVYEGGCQYQNEICQQRFMNKQTVSFALRQLKKKGLVQVEIPPENQRLRRVTLTPEGLQFSRDHFDRLRTLEEKAWSSLTEEEQTAILCGMRKINRVLSSELKTK